MQWSQKIMNKRLEQNLYNIIDDSTNTGRPWTNWKVEKEETTLEQTNQPYFKLVSKNLDVFEKVQKELGIIPSTPVKDFLMQFILIFQQKLEEIIERRDLSNYLSPMLMDIEDDGSIFLEWIFTNARVGFTIEENTADSSWFFIRDLETEVQSNSGKLDLSNMTVVITEMINNVLEYS